MFKKVSTIIIACGIEVKRAGIHSILASLCCRIKLTISLLQQRPALTLGYLFAVIATPFALPHIKTPNATSPLFTAFATGPAKSG